MINRKMLKRNMIKRLKKIKRISKLTVFLVILSMVFLLCACAKKEAEVVEEEIVMEKSTPDPNAIMQAQSDMIVTEEEPEEVYNFPPSSLVCVMPKSFKASDYEGEYLNKNYPKDVSSINHVIVDSDVNLTKKPKEEFKEEIEKDFEEAYGDKVEIEITQYDKIKVDGRPGLWIMYNYDFRGEHYYVLSVILYNGKESNYITFLEGPNAKWMEEYIKAAETLAYEVN